MKKLLISFLILLSLQGCGPRARVLSGSDAVLVPVGERAPGMAHILKETALAP